MQKANSRLSGNNKDKIITEKIVEKTNQQNKPINITKQNEETPIKKWLRNYFNFAQLLVIGLFFYFLLFLLMFNIQPQLIANFILPNLYLPFQIIFFTGNFFVFSFLWQNKNRGPITAIYVEIFLLLFFQEVEIDIKVFLLILLFWSLTISLTFIKKPKIQKLEQIIDQIEI